MTSDKFFDAIANQMHVALISAAMSAKMAFGHGDRHVVALAHLAQAALALHDRQYDVARDRMAMACDALARVDA